MSKIQIILKALVNCQTVKSGFEGNDFAEDLITIKIIDDNGGTTSIKMDEQEQQEAADYFQYLASLIKNPKQ